MSKSNIEWTTETWNPIVGCSVLSPGCTNCYAMKMAHRIEAMNLEAESRGKGKSAPQYDGTTRVVNGKAVWTGKLALAGDNVLLAPLKRKKPTTYFVNSMSDLFHEDAPDQWIDRIFAVMALCPQHTFQVLTKRAERMRGYMDRLYGAEASPRGFVCPPWSNLLNQVERRWMDADPSYMADIRPLLLRGLQGGRTLPNGPLPNVWLGVSTEDQKRADERIPHLLQTPAAVRFISAEPLLGHIALHALNLATPTPCDALRGVQCVPDDSHDGFHNEPMNKLDWVIVGGESGPDARPMHPEWVRTIRDWCQATGVSFFFKQWGEWRQRDCVHVGREHAVFNPDGSLTMGVGAGTAVECLRTHVVMERMGKRRAGRLLDGITHDAMPDDHVITPARRAAE